ncbi:MAG: helix-turn-helix transcriptional regulator, partial [Nocardioides sp.]|uniref:helix-turn-helix domain-containing protein n=1 Tax=Nocardioides sp. TaxID=35761 RepID=UPI00239AAA14
PDHSYDRQVGLNLRAMRDLKGITQAQLGRMLDEAGLPMSQQTIVKVEQGSRPIRLQEAQKIAEVLEVDVYNLMMDVSPDKTAQVARLVLQCREHADTAELAIDNWYRHRGELESLVSGMQAAGRLGDLLPEVKSSAFDQITRDVIATLSNRYSDG